MISHGTEEGVAHLGGGKVSIALAAWQGACSSLETIFPPWELPGTVVAGKEHRPDLTSPVSAVPPHPPI